MDRLRVELSAGCLQGIPPPRRPAHGAWSWLRSTLSAFSARRFHQISLPSARPARIELASSEWHSEAQPVDQGRMVGNGRNRTSCPKGLRLQRSGGTSLPLWHSPKWLRRTESNDLPPAYEAGELPMLHTASKVARLELSRVPSVHPGSAEYWRSADVSIAMRLLALTRFERGSGAALIDAPWRKAAVSIRRRLRAPAAFQAVPRTRAIDLPCWRRAGAFEAHALRHHRFSKPRQRPRWFTLRVGRHDRNRTCILSLRRAALVR